jgi:hypothetical protein
MRILMAASPDASRCQSDRVRRQRPLPRARETSFALRFPGASFGRFCLAGVAEDESLAAAPGTCVTTLTLGSNEPYSLGAVMASGRWLMDAYGTARLAAKDAESAIVSRICEDFNLTPVLARAHHEQMARHFADYGHVATSAGELCYLAVRANEPPGRPIIACRKVQVAVELAAAENQDALRSRGLAAMRQGRLDRLARQAQVQGGLLTVEDLAYLTCSSSATVKRDMAASRAAGVAVATGARSKTSDLGCRTSQPSCSCTCGGCSSPRSRAAPAIRRARSSATWPTSARSPPSTPEERRSRDQGGHRPLRFVDRRLHRALRTGPAEVPGRPPALCAPGRRAGEVEKGGPAVKSEALHLVDARRLARRSLPSQLRYKFLHGSHTASGASASRAVVRPCPPR